MSTKMWEVTVEHAETCVLDKRIYLYCSPQGTGVVFNLVGRVMYLLLECEYIPVSKLSETQKVDAQNLVLLAFAHWGEVVSFDDEASLLGGGLSSVANVHETSSSPRGEDYNASHLLAFKEIGGFDYTPPPASSPDIISSIYSVGGTSGLDDYALHNIEGMSLRYDQALTFPDSIAHAFFNDDHLQFFDTDLHSPTIPPQSPTDLQSSVDGFLSAQRSTAVVAAADKAQRRWTKLFSVLKWFSIRRSVRNRVRDIPRY